MREHRLYQADWLIRFYGFDVPEIVAGGASGRREDASGMGEKAE